MKKTLTILGLSVLMSSAFAQAPTTGAPDPTADAADVISLFAGPYTNVAVTSWRTDWSSGVLTDTTIDGNDMKRYSSMGFAGIETTGANLIDASGMTHFNIDLWTSNATLFKLKLVDFGADGVYSPANAGGDDTEHELVFSTGDNKGEWIHYNIPLSYFTGLAASSHMAQFILVAEPFGTSEIYVDNIYFSNNGPEAAPTAGAADPTDDSADVISMFSDVYEDVAVNTWRTDWSSATLTEMDIDGNNVKKYTGVNVIGIEAVGENIIDASEMDYFNLDVWSPNFSKFKIKLVDWGADGGYDGGDDSEHEITFDAPATGEWIKYRIPMSDFTGLQGTDKLAQFILVAETRGIPTVYIDNVYFSKESTNSTADVAAIGVKVYPNPAQGVLNVNLSNSTEKVNEISLMDAQGRVVSSIIPASNSSHTFDVSSLSAGIYVLQLNGENSISTRKVIVK
jgi:hypothetical protein